LFYQQSNLVLSTKRLVAAANFLFAATKILFVALNFAAVTKPFFSVFVAKSSGVKQNVLTNKLILLLGSKALSRFLTV